MKRVLVVFAMLAIAVVGLAAPDDEAQIRAVIARNSEGWTKNNAAILAEVLAEDVVFTENGGLNDGRASVLDHVRHDHESVKSMTLSSDVQRVHVAGNMAWVYAIERAVLEPKEGEAITLKSYSILVLEKKNGRWWIAAHSLSARRERPAAPAKESN